ncbi:uncharacterized protein LOC128366088 [Scomber japonicus]|uniref:uncharacterized protein LOC128366088 n=1 Tax=Scomber japonicus TaxID=13676 RepID=UPI0023052B22|nr:uncharacterized protein LOC128366088 [Scomber japonicus]
MEITTLLTLLVHLSAITLTTQDLVTLHVSPEVTAECGAQVHLTCHVSPVDGLSIKQLVWSQNKPLCSVDSEGKLTINNNNTTRGFHCEYKVGQLSLIFQKVQPLDIGQYMCKLRSNWGVKHGSTDVKLQECNATATGDMTSDRLSCTFSHVYPDGDVHWFHNTRRLSGESVVHNTTKHVEDSGYLTIRSHLELKGLEAPFYCCLKSTKSGRYIAGTLVGNRQLSKVPPPLENHTDVFRSDCVHYVASPPPAIRLTANA